MTETPEAPSGEGGHDLIDLATTGISKAALNVLSAAAPSATSGLIRTAGDIFGGLIGDRIHYWRQRNLIDSLEKTAQHIERKGVNLKDSRPLPEGELYAIFDGASKADEPDVQRMWASLLAFSLDPNGDHSEVPKYARTIEQLSGAEARLLEFLGYASRWKIRFRKLRKLRNPVKDPEGTRGVDSDIIDHLSLLQRKLSDMLGDQSKDHLRWIGNLQRLGCAARDFEVANAGDILEEIEVPRSSRQGYIYAVKAGEFEKLIDDIVVQIAILSGQHETYGDSAIIDPGSSYRPVAYVLTDYGENLVRTCSLDR